jgi:hypothetical protein
MFSGHLTLRVKHRLRLFENRVMRRIFGPRRYEVTGSLRKLHNEELAKYKDKMGRTCNTNGIGI